MPYLVWNSHYCYWQWVGKARLEKAVLRLAKPSRPDIKNPVANWPSGVLMEIGHLILHKIVPFVSTSRRRLWTRHCGFLVYPITRSVQETRRQKDGLSGLYKWIILQLGIFDSIGHQFQKFQTFSIQATISPVTILLDEMKTQLTCRLTTETQMSPAQNKWAQNKWPSCKNILMPIWEASPTKLPIFHAANFLHALFEFKGTKLSGDEWAQ
jgi:hypothetical protein